MNARSAARPILAIKAIFQQKCVKGLERYPKAVSIAFLIITTIVALSK
jgi:hypothetical protein